MGGSRNSRNEESNPAILFYILFCTSIVNQVITSHWKNTLRSRGIWKHPNQIAYSNRFLFKKHFVFSCFEKKNEDKDVHLQSQAHVKYTLNLNSFNYDYVLFFKIINCIFFLLRIGLQCVFSIVYTCRESIMCNVGVWYSMQTSLCGIYMRLFKKVVLRRTQSTFHL